MRRLAFVAESDTALRSLLAQVLRRSWEIRGAASGAELRADLERGAGPEMSRVLVVVSARLASDCAADIAELAQARRCARLAPLQVLVTCELGELGRVLPNLEPAELIGTLEKPFDIDLLEELVSNGLAEAHTARSS
jgi:DNA-binding NtrC family response regulator